MHLEPKFAKYAHKDILKGRAANKFIGRGSDRSSTALYAAQCGKVANCGQYCASDVVLISAEGARTCRLEIDRDEIGLACDARVRFVTDNPVNRERYYNSGERDVAAFLASRGYTEAAGSDFSVWLPKKDS